MSASNPALALLKQTTLTFLMRPAASSIGGRELLLAMKKRGFGVGKWNGPGGKVEPQDGSVLNGAIRETMEEVGVDAKDLRHRGYLIFYFESNPAWDMRVHVYSGTKWTGEPAESEEMKPQWYHESKLPFAEMWEDDKIWLPELLASEEAFIDYSFWFDKEMKLSRYHKNE